MIAIIDYGLGNVKAFVNVYKRLNIPCKIAVEAEDLKNVSRIILPGVGAFDHAMESLQKSGMRETLDRLVVRDKLPVLGICVGMQILARSSDEGSAPGLGWINGTVKRIDTSLLTQKPHLPHMGWNTIKPLQENELFYKLMSQPRFYFLHSYYFQCSELQDELAATQYGRQFTSVVNFENIYGVQFHPEKSHYNGIQLLRNFENISQC